MASDASEQPIGEGPGWWIEDGERVNAAYPRSFFIPPREHRADVRPGEIANLSFGEGDRPADGMRPTKLTGEAVGGAVERLWVEVDEIMPDGSYRGRVESDPEILTAVLQRGDAVAFGPQHVIALDYSPQELGYDPDAWAIIDARITEEDSPPEALTFAEPNGMEERYWFAALDQQPPQDSAWATLGELTDRFPELAVVFQAGGGMWRREKSSGGYTQV